MKNNECAYYQLPTWLIIGSAIILLSACRITYIHDRDDEDNNQERFTSELVVRDSFSQVSDTFNVGENITLDVTLTNLSDQTQTLEFITNQHYDFFITNTNFNPIWNWSADQIFVDTTTSITLAPNTNINFTVTWDQSDNNNQPVIAGEYLLQAIIPVSGEGLNQHLSQQQSEFRTSISRITIQ